jgi:isopenicillin N synthase-like dioxygenase
LTLRTEVERLIPLIDIGPLRAANRNPAEIASMAAALSEACRTHGFFYLTGHGVSHELTQRLEQLSHAFFDLPEEEKMRMAMEKGGRAWRGYFPVGGELTSGLPDLKEGIYFGSELGEDDWRVKAGMPMHGQNLFPESPAGFRDTVLHHMEQVTHAGHLVMEALALSLGLAPQYFHDRLTADPLILFRIFHYPPHPPEATQWGVGEHTDYGLLTILLQDYVGGLQVKSGGQWVDAPPIPGTFVCNIGDMLDRMTGGLYRSTPHRVLNASGRRRLSFPLFFDPSFASRVHRIEGIDTVDDDRDQRWDGASVHDFEGTYGDYLLRKVSGAFPQLGRDLL